MGDDISVRIVSSAAMSRCTCEVDHPNSSFAHFANVLSKEPPYPRLVPVGQGSVFSRPENLACLACHEVRPSDFVPRSLFSPAGPW